MDAGKQIVKVSQSGEFGFLGSISSVKINGVAVPPRLIMEHSGTAELVLEGENLTPDTLKLYHNGVLYTPLESSDTYAYYLLGDNGTNKVMLNGKNVFTIVVKDIVKPTGLPTTIRGYQKSDTSISHGASVVSNPMRVQNANCINYPFKTSEALMYFLMTLELSDSIEGDFNFENCTLNNYSQTSDLASLNVTVTDPSKPAYITYQGFIIAVFNYTNG